MKMEKGLIMKMAIAGGLGIAAIVIIAIAISMLGNDGKKGPKNSAPTSLTDQKTQLPSPEEDEGMVEYARKLVLVKAMDNEKNTMEVYDVEDHLLVTLTISSAVIFEDEYGSAIVRDQILPGYMVNVKYNKATFIPEYVKIAPQIQKITNLSSLSVDEELKQIQIGSDIYSYTDELIASDGENPLVLSELTIEDDIVVRAYKGNIWSIIVENGHGYIVLENYSAYLDGRLDVGNRTSYTITKDMRVAVSVGIHQVVITKEDMTPYSASVFIEEDEDYVIDLSDLQPKVSEVVFEVVQEGSTLYLNDEKIENIGESVKLDYGQYSIKVTNEGYMDWEGILVVDQPFIQQTIDMEIIPLYLHMTGPEGSEFYIDGILQGVMNGTDPIDVPIVPGGHILTLRKAGYISWSQSVYVQDEGEDYYYTVSALTEIASGDTSSG